MCRRIFRDFYSNESAKKSYYSSDGLTLLSIPPDLIRKIIEVNAKDHFQLISPVWNGLFIEYRKKPIKHVFLDTEQQLKITVNNCYVKHFLGVSSAFKISQEKDSLNESVLDFNWAVMAIDPEEKWKLVACFLRQMFKRAESIQTLEIWSQSHENIKHIHKMMGNLEISKMIINSCSIDASYRECLIDLIRENRTFEVQIFTMERFEDNDLANLLMQLSEVCSSLYIGTHYSDDISDISQLNALAKDLVDTKRMTAVRMFRGKNLIDHCTASFEFMRMFDVFP